MSLSVHKTYMQEFDRNIYQLTSLDITESKEPDADVSVNCPLLRFTIRAAAVVYKPRRVAFRASVNHTIL